MPSQDATPAPPGSPLSRRSVLRGAASAGAAGLAIGAIGTIGTAAVTSTTSYQAAGATTGHIVVHVRDAASGDIEVFSGTTQTRVRDRDLAARITRAIR
jgi:hypothetical protein